MNPPNNYPSRHTGAFTVQSTGFRGETHCAMAYVEQASAGSTGTADFTMTRNEQWGTITVAITPEVPTLSVDHVRAKVHYHYDALDITEVSYGNDGVYVYFRVGCSADPQGKYFNLWMDCDWEDDPSEAGDSGNTLDGADRYPDYRVDTDAMVADEGGPGAPKLYYYSAGWVQNASATVEIDRTTGGGVPDNAFDMRFKLSDIGYVYPGQAGDMHLVWVSGTTDGNTPSSYVIAPRIAAIGR